MDILITFGSTSLPSAAPAKPAGPSYVTSTGESYKAADMAEWHRAAVKVGKAAIRSAGLDQVARLAVLDQCEAHIEAAKSWDAATSGAGEIDAAIDASEAVFIDHGEGMTLEEAIKASDRDDWQGRPGALKG